MPEDYCQFWKISEFLSNLFTHCLIHILPQGLNLKHSAFGRVSKMKLIEIFVALESSWSKQAQILLLLTNSNAQTHRSPRLISPTEIVVEKPSIFDQYWLEKLSILLCFGILMDHKSLKCLWYELASSCELLFLQENWPTYSVEGLKIKASNCFKWFRQKSLTLLRQ